VRPDRTPFSRAFDPAVRLVGLGIVIHETVFDDGLGDRPWLLLAACAMMAGLDAVRALSRRGPQP
jgi:hypothetical protein